jgi:type IV pilus assembly protein PilE
VRKNSGFSLVEVLIVVAIVAILAAIAWPAYQSQVRKGHRADAQAYMLDLANKEQQYLLDARSYATGGTAIADLNATPPTSVSNFYTVSIAAGATTPSFVITATPTGTQVPDGTLTLDNTGQKTRNGVAGW